MREQRKGNPAVLVLVCALLLLLPEPLHAGKKEEGGPVSIGQDLDNKKSKKDGDLPPFPIVIDQPGAYVLVTNLDLTAVTDPTTDAIEIRADRVTLDLGGFSIVGPVTCDGSPVSTCNPAGDDTSGSGIDACPTGECARDTTLKNGTVRGMFGRGVKLGDGARVKQLRVLENATNGIELGAGAIVDHCLAERNGADGIQASDQSRVNGSTTRGNGAAGVVVGQASQVAKNVAAGNTQGLVMDDNTGYDGNVITGNGTDVVFAPGADPVELGKNLCGNTSSCP